MKNLTLTLFLILTCRVGFCQKQAPFLRAAFSIDSLPKQGILLDKNWKWHAGDNADFAKAGFDDSKWDTINPTLHFDKLPQVIEAEIGWFRLSFSVDSSLLNKPILMDFTPTGALEVYLNGKSVHEIGKVSKDPAMEETHSADNVPYTFVLTHTGTNNFSIRYSFTKSNHYFLGQSPFSVSLRQPEEFAFNVRKNTFSQIAIAFEVGLLFIMAFLHLCFYYFYPPQKANFIFSLALFSYAICLFTLDLRYLISPKLSIYALLNVTNWFCNMIYFVLILTAVYQYTNQRFTRFFWFIVGLYFVYLITIWGRRLNLTDEDFFQGPILAVTFLNYIYVSYKARKSSIKSASFIFFGGIFLLFYTIIIIPLYIYINNNHIINDLTLFYLGFLMGILFNITIPVSLSLALARDFAQTSFSLQQNLDEVKQLSEEKQQILSTQNQTLEKQVEERTAQLKASQNQLIQKEKLASLGELTAGIAHEIQNPLNFVNNFSELSVDLAKELKEEIEKSPLTPDGGIILKDKEFIDEIVGDLSQNQEKINHHGKRASSIVKGMLEHSRTGTGESQLTDINQLADEYLRLAYHGMKAKDNTFQADYELIADQNLPKINIVPQEIGRVLLNLINNAFYAVNAPGVTNPKVIVSTSQSDKQVIIKVQDNGPGIPEAIKAKIFQPFFTTKPTGEGTGLGLSLSYDIVTKGHGGTLAVESSEKNGAEFLIKLPTQS